MRVGGGKMAVWLRNVGAVLLIVCFVLPMVSCSEYQNEEGESVMVDAGEEVPPGVQRVTTKFYLLDMLDREDPWSWLRVAAFIFPLAVVGARWRFTDAKAVRMLWYSEPFVLVGVGYVLVSMAIFHSPEIGYYLAVFSVAIYFLGWVLEAWERFRTWRRKRAPSSIPEPP